MPTIPRINITLDKAHAAELSQIAQSEQRTVASLAKELLFEALEHQDAFVLSSLTNARDTKTANREKHKDVWK